MKPFTNVRVTKVTDLVDRVDCLDGGGYYFVERNKEGNLYWIIMKG